MNCKTAHHKNDVHVGYCDVNIGDNGVNVSFIKIRGKTDICITVTNVNGNQFIQQTYYSMQAIQP